MNTRFSFPMGVYITTKYKNKKPWSLLCFVYLLDSGIIYIKSAFIRLGMYQFKCVMTLETTKMKILYENVE